MAQKSGKSDPTQLSLSVKQSIVSGVWKAVVKGERSNCAPLKHPDEIQLFSQCVTALSRCLRLPLNRRKAEVLKEICSEQRLPKDVAEELLKRLLSQEQQIVKFPHIKSNPSLTDVSWRIKVVISSSSVSRILTPYVEMSLLLSNGRMIQLVMSTTKFARLRYELARLLGEMIQLERRPTISA